MTTALDIISLSLQQIQSYAPGEEISAADAQLCLSILNGMLDSFSVGEKLVCFADVTVSKLLQANVTRYSIGIGGDINATRPTGFYNGYGWAYCLDSNSNNYPVKIVSEYEWNLLLNKEMNHSTFPTIMWYDPQMPLGYINLYPKPTGNNITFYLSYPKILANLTLNEIIVLPPGYQEMLMSNLSIRIKPFFLKGDLDPLIYQQAETSKGNVKRSNLKSIRSGVDQEIIATGGVYNIYTDRYSSIPPRR